MFGKITDYCLDISQGISVEDTGIPHQGLTGIENLIKEHLEEMFKVIKPSGDEGKQVNIETFVTSFDVEDAVPSKSLYAKASAPRFEEDSKLKGPEIKASNSEKKTFLDVLKELVLIHGIDLFSLFKKLKAEILIPIFLATFATLDYPHEDLEEAFSIIKKHAPMDSI